MDIEAAAGIGLISGVAAVSVSTILQRWAIIGFIRRNVSQMTADRMSDSATNIGRRYETFILSNWLVNAAGGGILGGVIGGVVWWINNLAHTPK